MKKIFTCLQGRKNEQCWLLITKNPGSIYDTQKPKSSSRALVTVRVKEKKFMRISLVCTPSSPTHSTHQGTPRTPKKCGGF